MTMLHVACGGTGWCDKEIVDFLLANNMPINIQANNGRTALHYAVEKDQIEIVKLLKQKGADLTLKDDSGRTALHIAQSKGLSTIANMLTG
jgi:serine/threonine-protein phosphatase 6 regulatory ankyrin repeat subunit A